MNTDPEGNGRAAMLCEPCQMFDWRDAEAVEQVGHDFTPVCEWHRSHSFSQAPPTCFLEGCDRWGDEEVKVTVTATGASSDLSVCAPHKEMLTLHD